MKQRLNQREQEYVLSQVIQQNFDKRRGLSVFQSKSARTSFAPKSQAPPVGIYEHKFATGLKQNIKKKGSKTMSIVELPYQAEPS